VGRRRDTDQLDLFQAMAACASSRSDRARSEATVDCDLELRRALSDAIRQSGVSRDVVADRMSALLGDTVTKVKIDSWTAESKRANRFPAAYLPAFCLACDAHDPLELLARLAGRWLATPKDRLLAARGAIAEEKEDIRRREKLLRTMLAQSEGDVA